MRAPVVVRSPSDRCPPRRWPRRRCPGHGDRPVVVGVDHHHRILVGEKQPVQQLRQLAAGVAGGDQRAFEVAGHVGDRLKPLGDVDRQRAHHDPIELARDGRVQRRRRRDRRRQQLPHLADVVLGLEEPPAGQHLVKHHAQREHVGAGIERPHVDLLGRQIAHLPLDEPLFRLLLGERGGARDPEVEDLHRAVVGQHDVGGRDVLVDDLQRLAVGAVQACARSRARCRFGGRCRPPPGRASRAARGGAW